MGAETRIAELKAATDVAGEQLWTVKRLHELIKRRAALEIERDEEEKRCIAAESDCKDKYRMASFVFDVFSSTYSSLQLIHLICQSVDWSRDFVFPCTI